MAKCPWFSKHHVDPDPAVEGLGKGVGGTCLRCGLRYIVKETTPSYVLTRDGEGSALAIVALGSIGGKASYKKLMSAKGVSKGLKTLGITKKHLDK